MKAVACGECQLRMQPQHNGAWSSQRVHCDVDDRNVLLLRAVDRQGGRTLVKAIAVDRLSNEQHSVQVAVSRSICVSVASVNNHDLV